MNAQENNGDIPMNKKTLINQLITSVTEENVRRLLKERVLQEPEVKFRELGKCALRWTNMRTTEGKINQLNSKAVLDSGAVTNSDAVVNNGANSGSGCVREPSNGVRNNIPSDISSHSAPIIRSTTERNWGS